MSAIAQLYATNNATIGEITDFGIRYYNSCASKKITSGVSVLN